MMRWLAGLLLSTALASAQVVKPYPQHWGQAPAVETRELVDLPDGYGRGSTNLAQWITANLDKDKAARAQFKQVFACDFESAEPGKVPEEFMVLDGAFAVKAEGTNKFLELPGAPLDTFGVLFGPTLTNNASVNARIYGTNQGQRQPVFGVGLNGAGGLKLLVAPGKRVVEIMKGDQSVARSPYKWETGKWTLLRLRVRQAGEGEWEAQGKAWTEGSPEPGNWLVGFKEKSELAPGRATVWGSPIAGTPIRFDDLKVMAAGVGGAK
jgi:hypothetical protein